MTERLFGAVIFGLGVAMIVSALVRGAGPLAVGVVVGLAFTVLGALRFRASGGSS